MNTQQTPIYSDVDRSCPHRTRSDGRDSKIWYFLYPIYLSAHHKNTFLYIIYFQHAIWYDLPQDYGQVNKKQDNYTVYFLLMLSGVFHDNEKRWRRDATEIHTIYGDRIGPMIKQMQALHQKCGLTPGKHPVFNNTSSSVSWRYLKSAN